MSPEIVDLLSYLTDLLDDVPNDLGELHDWAYDLVETGVELMGVIERVQNATRPSS